MKHIRRFLHNTHAKTNYAVVLVAIVVVAVGVMGLDRGWFGDISLPFSVGDSGSSSNDDGNSVNRALQFSFIDKFSGSALASDTFYLYSGDSPTVLLESLTTDSAGLAHTAQKYQSGTPLFVKYLTGNAKMWYSVVVPTMGSDDAQSQTYNDINLQAFAIGTYSDALTVNAVDSSANYTVTTMSDNTAPVFKYELTNTGADNTGLMESLVSDPIYGDHWQVELVMKLSGTNYETIIPSGFDQVFSIGQATYGTIHMSANELTKWKVGSTYVNGFSGGQTVSFALDLSGYTGTAADMLVDVYAYADPSYAQTHGGNFGNSKVQLATMTVNIEDAPGE